MPTYDLGQSDKDKSTVNELVQFPPKSIILSYIFLSIHIYPILGFIHLHHDRVLGISKGKGCPCLSLSFLDLPFKHLNYSSDRVMFDREC